MISTNHIMVNNDESWGWSVSMQYETHGMISIVTCKPYQCTWTTYIQHVQQKHMLCKPECTYVCSCHCYGLWWPYTTYMCNNTSYQLMHGRRKAVYVIWLAHNTCVYVCQWQIDLFLAPAYCLADIMYPIDNTQVVWCGLRWSEMVWSCLIGLKSSGIEWSRVISEDLRWYYSCRWYRIYLFVLRWSRAVSDSLKWSLEA